MSDKFISEKDLIKFLEDCVEGEQGELYPPVFIIKPTDLQTFLQDNAVEFESVKYTRALREPVLIYIKKRTKK